MVQVTLISCRPPPLVVQVILISCVRSSPDQLASDQRHRLGFVANPKRFNVATTRAKALLVVVGDAKVLAK